MLKADEAVERKRGTITSESIILHESLNNKCMISRLFASCLNLLLMFINPDFGVLGLKATDQDINLSA